ncbi:erythroblast NAD(P)(+)--arginine ADP-ribosyltransferase-like isoform X1 [Tympanuchus pallidicinctus]|uniref:erythroblast NAD(P)(+)--arginine ADP-ribosyltransferase-like isoform X1 n=1 Tax=Tympanuchus pallidicinctus TaxID=109042 RepID=UPI002286DCE8|nr:erythroblast NAD(P)(+)--arginine ADP-ribosyltransferase-like isoform X1 [Tympanuchus pallidicinctus]
MGTWVLLHMEHVLLGWVLLLGALASVLATSSKRDLGPVKEVAMNMANTTFDDQYQGCRRMMEDELEELNRTEFTNEVYAEGWRNAAMEWRNRWGRADRPPALRRDQATAMLAYTMEGKLYHQFNTATREDGISRQHYLRSFPFKTLHFLLSRALQTLRESQPQRCHHVYRGVRGTRFTAQQGRVVRFGQFTSSSLRKKVAESFGQDTFFSVETCYGVPIKEFSTFPGEDEVLIPPFEQFRVTNITYNEGRTSIQLRSQGMNSTYNCEFVKEKRCKERPCAFIAGRSSPMEPPHLCVLLLAAAALAALGEP